MTLARAFRLFLLACATLLWLGLGGELLCRFEGDWRLDQLALARRPAPPPTPSGPLQLQGAARALLAQVTYQKGVNPDWFFLPPATVEKPANPELQARTAANPDMMQQENFLWN